MSSGALFLDRDGIINVDHGYVFSFDKFSMIKETLELIRLAKIHGLKVIVLTNQSGIERGYYTERDVIALHQEIDHYFFSHGLKIDGWYFSSSLTGEYRKPRPGMIKEAVLDHQINVHQSLMLGDKASDVLDFHGPDYFIVQGGYELSGVDLSKVQVFNSHHDFLDFFRKNFHRWSNS